MNNGYTEEIERLTGINEELAGALGDSLETLTYVKQYFEGTGLSAKEDCEESITKARAALAKAGVKP